jgi:hypothetical protein
VASMINDAISLELALDKQTLWGFRDLVGD